MNFSHRSVLTLNELLERRLICLKPPYWAPFYPHYKRVLERRGAQTEFPPPMILGAWWDYDDYQKNIRFLNQLAILKENHLLSHCLNELTSKPTDIWYRGENSIVPPINRNEHELWDSFRDILE
jgi:hypothetical protein